jgi:hypothetical protein
MMEFVKFIFDIFFEATLKRPPLAGEESGEGDIKIDIALSPLPCGVVKHTPQGRRQGRRGKGGTMV